MNRDYKTPTGAAPPDWRGLCEELVEALNRWVEPYMGPEYETELVIRDVDLIDRARESLTLPEREAVGPSDGEPPLGPFSEHDLRQQWNQQADEFNQWDSLDSSEQLAWAQVRAIAADRARYGRPAPAPAGEVAELVAWLRSTRAARLTRAADLLERQAAPVPVAVSERLPGAGDCDAEGFCWWFSPADPSAGTFGVAACWVLRKPEPEDDFRTHWLPAHALPVPSGEVES